MNILNFFLILWIVIIILLILFVIYIGICLYASNKFVQAALFRDSEWYEKTGHKLFNPDNYTKVRTKYTDIEDRQNADVDKFWQEEYTNEYKLNLDGDTIFAREFKQNDNANSHFWILAIHGYRSYGKRDMGYPALRFFHHGFNVLVPDLRAHGKSTGNKIGLGWLERKDIETWIKKITEVDPKAEIILFGGSMGGAAVLMTSGDKLPNNVKIIIADSAYDSIDKLFRDKLKHQFHFPTWPIVEFTNHYIKKYLGFSVADASTVKQLKKNKRPLLLLHGTKDKFVPHKALYPNLEASQGFKEGVLFKNAPHLSSWIWDERKYFDTVFNFINTILLDERQE